MWKTNSIASLINRHSFFSRNHRHEQPIHYPENLNPGMPGWEKVMIGVDVVLAAALIALEVLVVKRAMQKRKEEEVNA